MAIIAAKPTHWLMFSLAGTDWETANRRWGALRRQLTRTYRFQAAYVVERAPGAAELHLHVFWRGDLPPVDVLSEYAQAAGLGRYVGVGGLYFLQGAAHYVTKQVREGLQEEHAEMNGGRLIHATRRFWCIDGEVWPGGWAGVARELNRRRWAPADDEVVEPDPERGPLRPSVSGNVVRRLRHRPPGRPPTRSAHRSRPPVVIPAVVDNNLLRSGRMPQMIEVRRVYRLAEGRLRRRE